VARPKSRTPQSHTDEPRHQQSADAIAEQRSEHSAAGQVRQALGHLG
jgi:hypothetical protein